MPGQIKCSLYAKLRLKLTSKELPKLRNLRRYQKNKTSASENIEANIHYKYAIPHWDAIAQTTVLETQITIWIPFFYFN